MEYTCINIWDILCNYTKLQSNHMGYTVKPYGIYCVTIKGVNTEQTPHTHPRQEIIDPICCQWAMGCLFREFLRNLTMLRWDYIGLTSLVTMAKGVWVVSYWPFVRGNPPVTSGFPSQRASTCVVLLKLWVPDISALKTSWRLGWWHPLGRHDKILLRFRGQYDIVRFPWKLHTDMPARDILSKMRELLNWNLDIFAQKSAIINSV